MEWELKWCVAIILMGPALKTLLMCSSHISPSWRHYMDMPVLSVTVRTGNHEELGIESWGGSGSLSGCVEQLSSPTYPDTWELGKLFCSLDQWTLCYSSSSFCQCQCNVSWWLRAKRTSNDPSVLSYEGFWGPAYCSDLRSSVLWPVSLGYGYVVVKSLSHVRLLCGPLDCTSPGSSVHGILQGRILECVAIS